MKPSFKAGSLNQGGLWRAAREGSAILAQNINQADQYAFDF
jgi:hypothetical protein